MRLAHIVGMSIRNVLGVLAAALGSIACEMPLDAPGDDSGALRTDAGASPTDGGAVPGEIEIEIDPPLATLRPSATSTFTCTVTGTADTACSWSIEEGADGGSIDAGSYTAPSTTGTYHVVVTANADATKTARATVRVVAAATGAPGVWENVTPDGMEIDPSHEWDWGAGPVMVDPARPSDVYLCGFSSPDGSFWKSVDYGATWTLVTHEMGGAGAWSCELDPNPDRDPDTVPIMYASYSFGGGLHRSVDGGETWSASLPVGADNNDVCQIAVDPADVMHVMVGSHSDDRVYETVDGGETWTEHPAPRLGFLNPQLTFIDPGTVLAVFEGDGSDSDATFRGVRSGSTWPWTWTWTGVSDQRKFHGAHNVWIDPVTQTLYNGGALGIDRSTDHGLTWTRVSTTLGSIVIGTETHLYSTTNYATKGDFAPHIQIADIEGTEWTEVPTPPGMGNGQRSGDVTFDGSRYVIIGGHWLAGVWRYVEP